MEPEGLAVAGLVVIGAVAVFAVAAMHYNDTVLDANVCPQVAAVNAVLRTTLDTVSGVQFSDLHSCQYAEGADPRALWIDAAVPTGRGRAPARRAAIVCRSRWQVTRRARWRGAGTRPPAARRCTSRPATPTGNSPQT